MKGQCLCQSVSIETGDNNEFEVCHCSMCRRWGGGPFFAVHAGEHAQISGKENVSVFDSSDWGERAFCKNCGSHLYYRIKPSNQFILPLGLFQDTDNFTFKEQIFIDKKPDFYEFANETHTLTEQQVFDKYSG